MVSLRVPLSFALLLILGVLFAAEISAYVSSQEMCDSHQIEWSPVAETQHAEHACMDYCHTGQTHFGHCSVPLVQQNLKYVIVEGTLSLSDFLTKGMEEPFLEGLRRPPKIS